MSPMLPIFLAVMLAAPATPPPTKPASQPSTRPTAAKSTTRPTTRPAPTKPAATKPSPPKPVAVTPKPPPPELWKNIAQRRDRELRFDTLERLEAMLDSGNPADQQLALRTLSQVNQIKFDRTPFHERLRGLLKSPNGDVRALALQQLPNYDVDQTDLSAVTVMTSDASAWVRSLVPSVIVAANGRVGSAELDEALLKLLDDLDANVRRESYRAISNVGVSEDVEAKLIAMSYDPKIGRDVAHHALASRPVITEPVAIRLIELLDDPDQAGLVNRVAYSLRASVVPEAEDRVQEALLRVLDDSLNSNVRDNCIVALGRRSTPEVIDKLHEIATDPDEEDRIRNVAERVLLHGR